MGVSCSEAQEKTEILNSQFSSEHTEDTSSISDLGPGISVTVPPLHTEKKGVRKILESLNPHKGADQISSRFLKEMVGSISQAMKLIFQASYNQGQAPDDWNNAFITPLFKKGDKSKASNYRPVSLTSVTSKVMGNIVHSHIIKFLEEERILSDSQTASTVSAKKILCDSAD